MHLRALIALLFLLWAGFPAHADDFSTIVRPIVQRYCLECHSADEQEGELDLERFTSMDQVRLGAQSWQRVADQVLSGEMPPKEAPQPSPAERKAFDQWVRGMLAAEATRRAGDPGRVVLRRLNNAEFTYTLRDLTGLDAIEPAREFPADGAAGEGFTNTGQALVMSPALMTKYLDAAKDLASHAVLLPDGFRFSTGATARDWSEESLAAIRQFYARFTDAGSGGSRVNLQGIVFDTNGGGRIDVGAYLAATIAERAGLTAGTRTSAAVAAARGLNARYLATLWHGLTDPAPSVLLGSLQAKWRTATEADVPALVAEVAAWQKGLWQFSSVGHIGKLNGPTGWMTPVSPLASRQDVRFKIPPALDGQSVTISLVGSDAGDGPTDDVVVWRQPRLVAPGRPDLPLRDVRRVAADLDTQRDRLLAATTRYLAAAAEALATPGQVRVAASARAHDLDPGTLRAWFDLVGAVPADPVALRGHLPAPVVGVGGHAFINGWGCPDLPQLLANSADIPVRIPGTMKPHGVAVHPSPALQVVVGWQSPGSGSLVVTGSVQHAHPECGNGVTWTLEHRRGVTRTKLGSGVAQGANAAPIGSILGLAVQPGDVLTLAIGPRDGNHACDLTAVDLQIRDNAGQGWNLADDVSGDILAGNPHADRLGHPHVWHFVAEPDQGPVPPAPLPAGSVLARWRASADPAERDRLAVEVERLLVATANPLGDGPDGALRRQLRSVRGPLLGSTYRSNLNPPLSPDPTAWGLDPARFGADSSLTTLAPSVVSLRIPAELAEGTELVATAELADAAGPEGSAQVGVLAGVPVVTPGLQAGDSAVSLAGSTWTSTTRQTTHGTPVLVRDGSPARRRIEAAFDDFRALFPAALCYSKIVPVDEVVTLTLFYREDGHLSRLMLDEAQRAHLDRLWDELHFSSRDALTEVDAFAQLLEYASQDGDPKVFEPLRQPIMERAAAYRRRLVDAEPKQVDALVAFAGRAYRRPLTGAEGEQIRALYGRLRAETLPHDEAFRLTLARILVAPTFLYRAETPVAGSEPGPVSSHELATRLSYFLWSAPPDAELRALADSGQLADPMVLQAQTKRLLADPRVRRLATEFACQWLQIADFAGHDAKSERHFPSFLGLRGAMHEESVRFLTDLFQHDGSVLGLLDADHTFLNPALAEHYAIPLDPAAPADPDGWRRVDGIKRYGRGGILGQSTTLAEHSGASRTSPTLRGNWISEVLLGERLPRPPKGVAQLPEDEASTAGLTVRQLVTLHASNAACAGCHSRIDPLGFALEGFDAIGRKRSRDLGDRAIDDRSTTRDGAEFAGLPGLQHYLLTRRREAFVRQFCRKLLGFALGRATELSDEVLLTELAATLKANEYRVGPAIERITQSPQFRQIRGRDRADAE